MVCNKNSKNGSIAGFRKHENDNTCTSNCNICKKLGIQWQRFQPSRFDREFPDLMSCLPLSDFYQILLICYKIMKTKGKIANLQNFWQSVTVKHSYYTYLLSSRRALWYVITQAGMMSKFRKWHLRKPKLAKFPGGHAPRPPQKFAPSALIITPYFPSHGVGISAVVYFKQKEQ